MKKDAITCTKYFWLREPDGKLRCTHDNSPENGMLLGKAESFTEAWGLLEPLTDIGGRGGIDLLEVYTILCYEYWKPDGLFIKNSDWAGIKIDLNDMSHLMLDIIAKALKIYRERNIAENYRLQHGDEIN